MAKCNQLTLLLFKGLNSIGPTFQLLLGCYCKPIFDWSNVVQADLVGMQQELESEAKQLQQDRGKQERLATTITNQMQADAQVISHDVCNCLTQLARVTDKWADLSV